MRASGNVTLMEGGEIVAIGVSWEVATILCGLQAQTGIIATEMQETGTEPGDLPMRLSAGHWLWVLEVEADEQESYVADATREHRTPDPETEAFALALRTACNRLRALGVKPSQPQGSKEVTP